MVALLLVLFSLSFAALVVCVEAEKRGRKKLAKVAVIVAGVGTALYPIVAMLASAAPFWEARLWMALGLCYLVFGILVLTTKTPSTK